MPTDTDTAAILAGPHAWVAMGWQIVNGREPIVLLAASEEAAQMAWDEYVADEQAEDPDAEFELEYIVLQPIVSARR